MKLMMEKDLNVIMDTKKLKVLVCSRENNMRTRIKLENDKIIKKSRGWISYT